MKDRNGHEYRVGDLVRFYANDAGTLGTSEQRLFDEQWQIFNEPEKHIILFRADGSSPVAPSATPGEVLGRDRDGREVRKGDRIRCRCAGELCPYKDAPMVVGQLGPEGEFRPAGPNTMRQMIWPHSSVLSGPHVVTEPVAPAASDTLPSPAPTGSFVVGGCEYDEIPSRYGEADEDAVFKRQAARFAKLREEETAALGRFARLEAVVRSTTDGTSATILTDRVSPRGPEEDHSLMVELRCAGQSETLCIETRRYDGDARKMVAAALDRIAFNLGAKAMLTK